MNFCLTGEPLPFYTVDGAHTQSVWVQCRVVDNTAFLIVCRTVGHKSQLCSPTQFSGKSLGIPLALPKQITCFYIYQWARRAGDTLESTPHKYNSREVAVSVCCSKKKLEYYGTLKPNYILSQHKFSTWVWHLLFVCIRNEAIMEGPIFSIFPSSN